ncbi:kinase-like domain-containing protein, partial [Mycena latifolia]
MVSTCFPHSDCMKLTLKGACIAPGGGLNYISLIEWNRRPLLSGFCSSPKFQISKKKTVLGDPHSIGYVLLLPRALQPNLVAMSQQELSLGVLPPAALAEAVALANPSNLCDKWHIEPIRRQRLSQFSTVLWFGAGETPFGGETCFLVDAEPQVLGTGAAVEIQYERNADLAECEENTALDSPNSDSLDPDTIELILRRIPPKQGLRTIVRFRTLPSGSLHVAASVEPFHRGAGVLPSPVPLPAVLLSSLRATHRHRHAHGVLLVKTTLEPLSDNVRVLKLCDEASHLVKEVEFMTRLPEVDFLLRPTHVVLDEAGLFRGLLSDHHPASSLRVTMEVLHPDARLTPPVLPPSGVDQSSSSLARIPTSSLSWPVKLAWATDIAAAVAWLHAQAIVWADLKTDNILLCTDGHCRLIDYCLGGWTPPWCPPEAQQQLPWEGTAEGDVFALGLVLWCVAVEVGGGEREQEYASPQLLWTEGIPNWFQSLASSCLEHEPGRRPSARRRRVYETLRNGYTVL